MRLTGNQIMNDFALTSIALEFEEEYIVRKVHKSEVRMGKVKNFLGETFDFQSNMYAVHGKNGNILQYIIKKVDIKA